MIIKKLITDSMVARRSERGQSISLFALVIMGALITTTGLVIDGGQKVTATSRAESAAAGAGRAAGNAAATQQLGGADPAGAAVLAAKTYLAGQPGVDGTSLHLQRRRSGDDQRQEPTILLSIIGIGSVTGRGFSPGQHRAHRRLPMIMQFLQRSGPDNDDLTSSRAPRHRPGEDAKAEGRPAAASPATPQPPRMPGRRNPKWIALGIVALCLGGLLSYMIYARVASETAVVAAAHTVYRGETIEQGDLTTITLRGGSLPKAVPATQLE